MKRLLIFPLLFIVQMLFFNSMNAQQQNGPILEAGDTTFQAIYDKMVAYYDSQNSGGVLEEGSSEINSTVGRIFGGLALMKMEVFQAATKQ